MKFYFDKMPVRILYTDEEIEKCLLDFIGSQERQVFTFNHVSQYLINQSDENGKLDKEKDTIYNSGIILTEEDGRRLSKTLWNMILQGKIFIDFFRNPYSATSQNDYIFVINK